jgi:hypothetical protein
MRQHRVAGNNGEVFMKVLILATILLISCGSESDDSSSSNPSSTEVVSGIPTDPLIGSWFHPDGDYCGFSFEIKSDFYVMVYMCMIDDYTAEVSYKIVERDNNLQGIIAESTCDDVGEYNDFFGTINNDKLSIKTPSGLMMGIERNTSDDDAQITTIFGCYQSGEFQPTTVYK